MPLATTRINHHPRQPKKWKALLHGGRQLVTVLSHDFLLDLYVVDLERLPVAGQRAILVDLGAEVGQLVLLP